jgi:hypothetical protein
MFKASKTSFVFIMKGKKLSVAFASNIKVEKLKK